MAEQLQLFGQEGFWRAGHWLRMLEAALRTSLDDLYLPCKTFVDKYKGLCRCMDAWMLEEER